MDDFLAFLRTGAIQSLRVGASQAEVRALLGEPEDTSVSQPLIWQYDNREITFHGDDVMMIAVSVKADAGAVRKLLDDTGLGYDPHAELTSEPQIAVVIPASRVTLTLDLERPLARAFAT
jgi:hypothetical protein